MPRLVLASSSPRRRELLIKSGFVISKIVHPDVDETPLKSELPRAYVKRIALSKATAITLEPDEVLLACDTIVVMGRRIFGKPENALEAAQMLKKFSGRRHTVLSSICVAGEGRVIQKTVATVVQFKALHDDEIAFHTASNEWQGKSGGYAIQGLASVYTKKIVGSVTNVIGLPIMEAKCMLEQFGVMQSLEVLNK